LRQGRRLLRRIGRIVLATLGLIVMASVAVTAYLHWQSRTTPDTSGDYVALGSSFAAGIGLGRRSPGSPLQCLRSEGGYPSLVARRTGLKLVDMTCSGSTTQHVLEGGQLMLGAQIEAIGPQTRLVTLTTGGNDLGFVGDLMAGSGRLGAVGGWLHGPIRPASERPYDRVASNLSEIISRIRAKAPQAAILVISYPRILPEAGICPELGLTKGQADTGRDVAQRLALLTQLTARKGGAVYVDMDTTSLGHDACSDQPWVNGFQPETGTAFHPNARGATAVAEAVMAAWAPLSSSSGRH